MAKIMRTFLSAADIERLTNLEIQGTKFTGKIMGACALDNIKPNSFFFIDKWQENAHRLQLAIGIDAVLAIVKNETNINPPIPYIKCSNPRDIFAKILCHVYNYEENFLKFTPFSKKELNALNRVSIGNSVVISNDAVIGEGTVIQPNVVIGPETRIGRNCVIMSGCLIGAQGFGPIRKDKKIISMPHIGGVRIANNVELGAGSVVDSGTIEPTEIKAFVKTGSLVHIAHNVSIGEGCFLAARSGLSGSSSIGKNTFIGAGAMLRDGIQVGENVTIGMQSAVLSNVQSGATVFGNPARVAKVR